ncbi:c-type cytochrome [Nitratireductor sp. GCM10026969]|uniref:c-type cytochrome n=1 Tax=Nitratireductor sp. GCM10026969 TaxID=3252645 RepID=UPI003617F79E
MRATATVAMAAMAVTFPGTTAALAGGDFELGRAKSLQCVACHGERGMTPNPMFPHLAGQNAAYLEVQLEHFRTGQRYNAIMTPVAEALTREDIEDLATYFSSVGPLADAP